MTSSTRRTLGAAVAVALVLPGAAFAGKPAPEITTYAADINFRSAAGDLILDGGHGTYSGADGYRYVHDRHNGQPDSAVFYTGGDTYTLRFGETSSPCRFISPVSFRINGAGSQWYDDLGVDDAPRLGDAEVTCQAENGSSADRHQVTFPGSAEDPSLQCVVLDRLADTASGARVYAISPRVADPGSEGTPPDALYVLTGGQAGDPGTPPRAATSGCDAKVWFVRTVKNRTTRTLVYEGPAPFRMTVQTPAA